MDGNSDGRAVWDNRVGAAHAFIESNLEDENLNPRSVAQALGISVRRLHMLFAPTGVSVGRYILTRRLARVRHELADPRRKVTDIYLSCGIESQSAFYRGFRRMFGVNPTTYRQSLPGADESAVQRA